MGQLGDISPEGSIAIGIIVGLLSTSIQSLGLTLQRQSHLLEDEKTLPETRRPPYKRPRWQLGMFMFVVSNLVGSTIQITTLPLPVLSTLQASGLVFNTAFATLLLHEPFTRFSLIGTILTCGGAALIATFGAIGEPAHSLRQLLDLLAKRGFLMWMAGTMLVVIGTIVFSHLLKVYSSHKYMAKQIQKLERPRSNSKADIHAETRSRRQSFTSQLPRPLQLKVTRLKLIRGLSYALISGILSAHSLLVAKSAVELLVRTIFNHDNQFNQFQSWLILLALLFFALSQLYYLHLGLRLCSTSVLYPFVFCIYNIIAILDGLIYFRQASRLSALHGGLIALGTVVLLSGVLALSWRLDDTTPTDAAPQLMDSQTSLAPGMGFVRSPGDSERSPLLPYTRASAGSTPQLDERAPLLTRPARRTTLTRSSISPGGAATRDIWAELDDEDDDHYNILSLLPRTPSPFLTRDTLEMPKKRRRFSVPAKDDRDADADADVKTQPKRRQTLQSYSQDSAENAASKLQTALPPNDPKIHVSAEPANPSMDQPQRQSEPRKISRSQDRRVTVHFEEQNIRDTSPRSSRRSLNQRGGGVSSSGSGTRHKGSTEVLAEADGSGNEEDGTG